MSRIINHILSNLIGFVFLVCAILSMYIGETNKIQLSTIFFLVLACYSFIMVELENIKDKIK